MTSINITIGANTAKFQEAITNLQQTVDQTAEKISDSFKSVGKAIEQTKAKWADWASVSTGLRNTGRIVQELGSWLRTPLEQFSRFEDAATRLAPLVGGLENAKELCAQLRDEAAKSVASQLSRGASFSACSMPHPFFLRGAKRGRFVFSRREDGRAARRERRFFQGRNPACPAGAAPKTFSENPDF